ncbi:MAG TPA: OB-fold domain-containing protein [Acidimicrobiia bacterium]|jgi:uncharacterized OB-fold protein|nr:OB-fold domain-containing protein [Acidimicrobiia bacterium]
MNGAQRSIAPDLFDPDGNDGPVLHGGYSPTSGLHHFPRFARCPYTGADDVEPAELPTTGTLFLWTAVTAPPPGYAGPVPFGFGVVELPNGLRVITRITEPDPTALQAGASMRLVADVVAVDDDGTEVVAWAFAPESSAP